MTTTHLVDLDGREGERIKVRFFKSKAEGITLMKVDSATTACGDNGAINLWIDDQGKYRAEFYRWLKSKSRITATNLKEINKWLTVWMPEMHS